MSEHNQRTPVKWFAEKADREISIYTKWSAAITFAEESANISPETGSFDGEP